MWSDMQIQYAYHGHRCQVLPEEKNWEVLLQREKEKKDKYLQTCLEMQKDFTTMVYLVDGIAGHEARNAKRRLATHLASKWNHGYSQMVYYVGFGW